LSMSKSAALLLSLLMLLAAGFGQAGVPSAPSPEAAATAEYNAVVDQYFDAYFHFHPSEGTAAGFPQYDSPLEALSQHGREPALSFLLDAKQGACYYHTDRLNPEQRTDCIFQAEDGIRDWSVTGVQTCALPI